MASTDEREAIGALFKATWPTNTPVAWPNRKFTPPNGNWVRLTVLAGDSFQLTIGSGLNWFRHAGIVVVQCFTPLDIGDYEGRRLADIAAGIFRRQNIEGAVGIEGLQFKTPQVRVVGPDGSWFQVNCETEFYRDSLY